MRCLNIFCLSKSALLSYYKTSFHLNVVQPNPQKTQNVFPSAAVMQILEDGHQLIHRRRSRRRSPSSSTSSLKSGSQTSNKWKQCGKYKRNMAFVSCSNFRNITVSLSPHTADSLQFSWMPALLLEISRGHGEQMWWGLVLYRVRPWGLHGRLKCQVVFKLVTLIPAVSEHTILQKLE